MQHSSSNHPASRGGMTLSGLLTSVIVGVASVGVLLSISCNKGGGASLAVTTKKLHALGTAFQGYTADNGGLLPYEDVSGSDDFTNAGKAEAAEVWYNALPRQMGEKTVGEIGSSDASAFYSETYPLYIPGAPYPKSDKKFRKPYFAIAMNSRLQRKSEDGTKAQGTVASIVRPENTVLLLERGMPGDEKTIKAQKGFDAGPKASPRAFVARYKGKGLLLFVDGHTEVREPSQLIQKTGLIVVDPATVWTANPDDDPN